MRMIELVHNGNFVQDGFISCFLITLDNLDGIFLVPFLVTALLYNC
jgi:hypothetical protein